MADLTRFDDARQGEWDTLIGKLRGAGHEVGDAVRVDGDSFMLRVPVDGRPCSYPEAQEISREDDAK